MNAPTVRLIKALLRKIALYGGGIVAMLVFGIGIGVLFAWLVSLTASVGLKALAFVFSGDPDYPYFEFQPDVPMLIATSIIGIAFMLATLISVAVMKGVLDKLPPPIGYRAHLEPWVEK